VPSELLGGLAGRLESDHGFQLDATHVALSGTCRDCAAKHPAGAAPDRSDTSAGHPAGLEAQQ
jgi:Fur family ferric uptake transcriptional regulator